MEWQNIVLGFTGNAFLLGALGYYFNRRLKRLETDLKLKSLIDETVFKNMAATVKEATKRLLEYHRTVVEYCFARPRTDYSKAKNAVVQAYQEFNQWFEVESLHLPDGIKSDILTLFSHLNSIVFLKGMVLVNVEFEFKEDAKRENLELARERNKTEEILATYHAKMKSAIGVT